MGRRGSYPDLRAPLSVATYRLAASLRWRTHDTDCGWFSQTLIRLSAWVPLNVECQGPRRAGRTSEKPARVAKGCSVMEKPAHPIGKMWRLSLQEWRIVRILNVVDGCIPSDRATSTPEEIEEERRLLYVAMTRAKDELDLIVPQRFFTHQQAKLGDRHVYGSRRRFIPDSILGSFARRNWRDQTDWGPRSTLLRA